MTVELNHVRRRRLHVHRFRYVQTDVYITDIFDARIGPIRESWRCRCGETQEREVSA